MRTQLLTNISMSANDSIYDCHRQFNEYVTRLKLTVISHTMQTILLSTNQYLTTISFVYTEGK